MLTQIDSGEVEEVILHIAEEIHSRVDYLTELDSQLGDGDHGTNLDRGFAEIRRRLPEFEGDDIGALLELAGSSLISSMGGASGPLLGTAFVKAGHAVKGKSMIGVAEIAVMFEASEAAVANLGGAKVGDKTMLDSLHPAAEAATKTSKEGETDLVKALGQIVAAANSGLETTKTLVAKKGRAMYLGERGLGTYDAGAASLCIILSAALDALRRLDEGRTR
jgi:dihydroxyacetone kinase-like protein